MKNYKVIEDNGGGLTLVVFGEDDNVEYLHTGYEYNVGQLTHDIAEVKNGGDPANDWDGNAENPQQMYDDIISIECGWAIIADNDGVYPQKMGRAGREEFVTVDTQE